ncbi:hypothetical protein LM1A4_032 [Leuconostoc phage 1-A4]|uniref:Uncharacterized protein n=1 Tax=Leuconostoc phage 1-A4 TaxID=745088 RepID=D4N4K5_9CAUD|nr:hypothetical protein LM1A4_032 [Leuconostoc phage 1-A4]ADD71755.1 hypothetical protein LM1A4_032 [Leuconostoc phage 1-A4]
MTTKKIHAIELEDKKGNVFARFNNFAEYDEYLGDLALDLNDEDCDVDLNFETWYCYFIDGEIKSFIEAQ